MDRMKCYICAAEVSSRYTGRKPLCYKHLPHKETLERGEAMIKREIKRVPPVASLIEYYAKITKPTHTRTTLTTLGDLLVSK